MCFIWEFIGRIHCPINLKPDSATALNRRNHHKILFVSLYPPIFSFSCLLIYLQNIFPAICIARMMLGKLQLGSNYFLGELFLSLCNPAMHIISVQCSPVGWLNTDFSQPEREICFFRIYWALTAANHWGAHIVPTNSIQFNSIILYWPLKEKNIKVKQNSIVFV